MRERNYNDSSHATSKRAPLNKITIFPNFSKDKGYKMHLKNSREEKLSSFLRRVPRPLFLAFTFEVEFFKFTLEDALIEMNPLDSRSHISCLAASSCCHHDEDHRTRLEQIRTTSLYSSPIRDHLNGSNHLAIRPL